MEGQKPQITQEEFEKLVMERAAKLNTVKNKRFGAWGPEGFRRISRFGLYTILTNLPTDNYYKAYSRAYLPFAVRHHVAMTFLSVFLITQTVRVLYPPRY